MIAHTTGAYEFLFTVFDSPIDMWVFPKMVVPPKHPKHDDF